MAITYIVPGYGIARNAKQLEEVNKYIATVRTVINRESNLNGDKPVVVLSGGLLQLCRLIKKLKLTFYNQLGCNKIHLKMLIS
jgi:hypothetical protein